MARGFEIAIASGSERALDIQDDVRLAKIGLLYADKTILCSPNAWMMDSLHRIPDLSFEQRLRALEAVAAADDHPPHEVRDLATDIREYRRLEKKRLALTKRERMRKQELRRLFEDFSAHLASDGPFVEPTEPLRRLMATKLVELHPLGSVHDPDEVISGFTDFIQSSLAGDYRYPLFGDHVAGLVSQIMSDDPVELGDSAARRFRNAPLVARLFERLPLFEKATVDEILDIRRDLTGPLVRFRAAVIKLTEQIQTAPWEAGFESEVDELILRDVEPAIEEIADAARSTRYFERLFFGLVNKPAMAAGSGLGMVVSQVSSLPLLSAGAMGLAVGAVASWANTHRDWLDAQRAIQRNNLYFYYEAGKRLRR